MSHLILTSICLSIVNASLTNNIQQNFGDIIQQNYHAPVPNLVDGLGFITTLSLGYLLNGTLPISPEIFTPNNFSSVYYRMLMLFLCFHSLKLARVIKTPIRIYLITLMVSALYFCQDEAPEATLAWTRLFRATYYLYMMLISKIFSLFFSAHDSLILGEFSRLLLFFIHIHVNNLWSWVDSEISELNFTRV